MMNSIKLQNKRYTIFTNYEANKTFDPHRLLNLNFFKFALSNFSVYYTWKDVKRSYKNNKFKIQLQHGMKSLN